MDDVDNTQRETAETIAKMAAAIGAAQQQLADIAEKTKELLGEEAVAPGYAASVTARLSKEHQEKVRQEVAALEEELANELPKTVARRTVRVKPTRQMV